MKPNITIILLLSSLVSMAQVKKGNPKIMPDTLNITGTPYFKESKGKYYFQALSYVEPTSYYFGGYYPLSNNNKNCFGIGTLKYLIKIDNVRANTDSLILTIPKGRTKWRNDSTLVVYKQ